MTSVLRFFASLALFLSATVAFAHGDEKHGGEEARPAASEVAHAQPGHDMEATGSAAISNEAVEGHDDEQAQSEGTVSYTHLTLPTTPYV